MNDDAWLPGILRQTSARVRDAKLTGEGDALAHLRDGMERTMALTGVRTIDEIAAWSTLDDEARRGIVRALGERRVQRRQLRARPT